MALLKYLISIPIETITSIGDSFELLNKYCNYDGYYAFEITEHSYTFLKSNMNTQEILNLDDVNALKKGVSDVSLKLVKKPFFDQISFVNQSTLNQFEEVLIVSFVHKEKTAVCLFFMKNAGSLSQAEFEEFRFARHFLESTYRHFSDIQDFHEEFNTTNLVKTELDTIFNSVPAIIFYKNNKKQLIRINRAYEEQLGLTWAQLYLKDDYELFPEADADKYSAHDERVLAHGEVLRDIIEKVETPFGTKWLKTDKVPYKNDNGDIIGLIGLSIDITEMIKMDEELKVANALLTEKNFNLYQLYEEMAASEEELKVQNEKLILNEKELMQQKETIQKLAYFDLLTDIPNRYVFKKQCTETIAMDDKQDYALIYLDLDNFKFINDTMGHFIGDQILKQVALRFQMIFQQAVVFARLGGDEFAVFYKVESEASFMHMIDNMQTVTENPIVINNNPFYITFSTGIAMYPEHGDTYEELLKNADTAMYKAKAADHQTYVIFNDEMNQENKNRYDIEMCLRNALGAGEISIAYQPIVSAKTDKIIGFEALMRWVSPKLGRVTPDKFIPILERTGMIVAYGDWILYEACKQNRIWQQQSGYNTTISVNISVYQMKQKNFIDRLREILKETGMDPKYLDLEITESQLILDFADSEEKLKSLAAIGVNISLDDFGTGYSSLNYFINLTVNKIKIDKSFIFSIHSDRRTSSIIRALINMSHEFDIAVVAEGVETLDQLNFLKENSCDLIQGFYLHKPLPAADISQLLLS